MLGLREAVGGVDYAAVSDHVSEVPEGEPVRVVALRLTFPDKELSSVVNMCLY